MYLQYILILIPLNVALRVIHGDHLGVLFLGEAHTSFHNGHTKLTFSPAVNRCLFLLHLGQQSFYIVIVTGVKWYLSVVVTCVFS